MLFIYLDLENMDQSTRATIVRTMFNRYIFNWLMEKGKYIHLAIFFHSATPVQLSCQCAYFIAGKNGIWFHWACSNPGVTQPSSIKLLEGIIWPSMFKHLPSAKAQKPQQKSPNWNSSLQNKDVNLPSPCDTVSFFTYAWESFPMLLQAGRRGEGLEYVKWQMKKGNTFFLFLFCYLGKRLHFE